MTLAWVYVSTCYFQSGFNFNLAHLIFCFKQHHLHLLRHRIPSITWSSGMNQRARKVRLVATWSRSLTLTTLLSCTTHMQSKRFDIRVRRFRLWKLPELFVAVLVTLKVAYSEGQGVHLAFPEGFNGGLPICDRCVVVPALARHLGGH